MRLGETPNRHINTTRRSTFGRACAIEAKSSRNAAPSSRACGHARTRPQAKTTSGRDAAPGRRRPKGKFTMFLRCPLLARCMRYAYNASREFCFRAGWKSPLAVSAFVKRDGASPRALQVRARTQAGRRGRFGENPKPTVTVRMEEAEIRALQHRVARCRDVEPTRACSEGIHAGLFSFPAGGKPR